MTAPGVKATTDSTVAFYLSLAVVGALLILFSLFVVVSLFINLLIILVGGLAFYNGVILLFAHLAPSQSRPFHLPLRWRPREYSPLGVPRSGRRGPRRRGQFYPVLLRVVHARPRYGRHGILCVGRASRAWRSTGRLLRRLPEGLLGGRLGRVIPGAFTSRLPAIDSQLIETESGDVARGLAVVAIGRLPFPSAARR